MQIFETTQLTRYSTKIFIFIFLFLFFFLAHAEAIEEESKPHKTASSLLTNIVSNAVAGAEGRKSTKSYDPLGDLIKAKPPLPKPAACMPINVRKMTL